MSVIGDLIGDITGSNNQAEAAGQAAQLQSDAAMAGIAATDRRFDSLQALLKPFVDVGTGALTGQQNLLGLNGGSAQQTAIDGIRNSPAFTSALQQGENSLLQNASATGGLRGGNIQQALSQFSPQLLNQLIQQQYGNLGGLSSMGQSAAAGVGNAGMQAGANTANLLQQQGAALAGGQIAQGNRTANNFGSVMQIAGMAGGFF